MRDVPRAERFPTDEEVTQASFAADALSRSLDKSGCLLLGLPSDGKAQEIKLSAPISSLVLELLSHIARGDMVTLVSYGAELSTQKAADLLGVSRPHLTKLLEKGKIPYHKVGSHHRIRAHDLMAYKAMRDETRSKALDRLQQLGQELDAE